MPGRCRVRTWEPGVEGRGAAVPFRADKNVCNGQNKIVSKDLCWVNKAFLQAGPSLLAARPEYSVDLGDGQFGERVGVLSNPHAG